MHQNHVQKKLRRMDTNNLIRIQEARVRRKKTGWSKFVLRVLAYCGDLQAKWSLPHLPPRSRKEFELEQARKRTKNTEELRAMLAKNTSFNDDEIAAICGVVA